MNLLMFIAFKKQKLTLINWKKVLENQMVIMHISTIQKAAKAIAVLLYIRKLSLIRLNMDLVKKNLIKKVVFSPYFFMT